MFLTGRTDALSHAPKIDEQGKSLDSDPIRAPENTMFKSSRSDQRPKPMNIGRIRYIPPLLP